MAEQRGMGRGLAAILSSTNQEPAAARGDARSDGGLRSIEVTAITPNPDQPRQRFNEAGLQALSESVRERGLLQPVIVREQGDGYVLIAGERRWRAATLAGLETIPALVRIDDARASLELALIENMAREDLNPVEEARACAALVEDLGLTREEVGRRVGRSRVAVSNLTRLLDLPEEALGAIETGDLSEGHGRALLLAPDHSQRRRLTRAAIEGGWSVREVEARARETRVTPGRRSRRGQRTELHPDQAAALSEIADTVGSAVGADVRVALEGEGARITLSFASLDAARAFATRIAAE